MKRLFQSQESLIAEIHYAFDSAQDRLLEQANELLKTKVDTVTTVEKISERLAGKGFVNTPTALKGKQLKEKREADKSILVKTEEQANLINYYKQTYPFLKFLTEDELNRICEKYNLIHAPVGNYIQEVPEKNLRDIEIAQGLKDTDKDVPLFRLIGNSHMGSMSSFLKKLGKSEPLFSEQEYKKLLSEYYGWDSWTVDNSTGWYVVSRGVLADGTSVSPTKIEVVEKGGLFIAAPSSHFKLDGLKKKSKHGFFKVFETEVKDPIVFRYVRGGVQVITKWGLEANDPALVVPELN